MNITIVGGGFGGAKAALELAKDEEMKITLISANKNFVYYPALYSTATGYHHKESWVPLEFIFRDYDNVELIYDTITTMDPDAKTIRSRRQVYHYSKLILALGSVTTYFGIEGLDHYAFGIKSEEEIRELQKHLFYQMGDKGIMDKRYIVIGGGPTGVELAGALGAYLERLREFFGLKEQKIQVTLVEANPRILPRMSKASSKAAKKRLEGLGVKIETNKRVESATAHGLTINGRSIKTQTIIWTSGVANAPFYKKHTKHFDLNPRGRVIVDDYLVARPNVYVIGDNADTPLSGLAQTAIHDAVFVARNIKRAKAGLKLRKYKPKNLGVVVPIGSNWAIYERGAIRLTGVPGAIMRDLADIIGHHDILPMGHAIDNWRAGSKPRLRIPEDLSAAD